MVRRGELNWLEQERGMRMNIRPKGLDWFRERFGDLCVPVHVSKRYPPEESATKHAAWWFEIPPNEFGGEEGPEIFLVYEVPEGAEPFGCLRIPAAVFQSCEHHLHVRPDNGHISLFLSAEPADRLVDRRGDGAIRFAPFAWHPRGHAC
jgi:hypothetical protein